MPIQAQCKGKENILAMFNNRGIDAWSIFQGKQFLFTGIGEPELEEMLTMMEQGSNCCYTLKVYKGITDTADITEKTSASGSFNFYLFQRERERDPDNEGRSRGRSERTLGAIQRRIEEKIADKIGLIMDAEDSPGIPAPERLEDILKQPERVKEYLEVIGMIKNIFSGNPIIPAMQPAQIGNAHRVTDSIQHDADTQTRLINAINTLELNDPKILEHLEKLAKISETNKPFFNNLIVMLASIQ